MFPNSSNSALTSLPDVSPTPANCNQDDSFSTPQQNSFVGPYILTTAEAAAVGLVFGALWLVSVFGNVLVCLVINRSRRTQSTTNYFVVAMACADLLLSFGCSPFILLQVNSRQWMQNNMMCKVVRYIQYLSPDVQVFVLLSICIDRFYTIVYPLSFKVSREKAKKMILASWMFNVAFVSPCFIFYGASQDGSCNFFLPHSWDGISFGVTHLLVGFVGPVSLLFFFYNKVVKYIWRLSSNGCTVRRTMNIVPRTKVKTIKMFLMLNAVFVLTWMPFYVAQLWHPKDATSRQGVLFYVAVTWVSFSSTASKPTLYAVYNANFRRGMKETFCMSSMKCYRSNAYTITTSSRIAKKNYVGILEVPAPTKPVTKDSLYEAFNREAKEKKLAWPIDTNPPNTFV